MGKQSKNKSNGSDDRDVNKSPIKDLPKSRSDHSERIIKLLKKIDQPTMVHSNSDSYINYLETVHRRLKTYDQDDEKFRDYEEEKAKLNEKPKRKSNRKK